MNVKIVYHSDSGNTKKLALAISEATGVPAEEITGHPDIRDVDLLFVGGSVRAFSLEKNCKDFLKSLTASQVKNVALLRIGRTSCVFQPVRDTAKSDKGASIKSLEG